ncbi:hypothetical protein MY11210_007377 [Beauveria gryllotalpidicola]
MSTRDSGWDPGPRCRRDCGWRWSKSTCARMLSPQEFGLLDESRPRQGKKMLEAANCIEVLPSFVLPYAFKMELEKKDKMCAAMQETRQGVAELNERVFTDMTDKENLNFVHVY